jgi:hypothetical protein
MRRGGGPSTSGPGYYNGRHYTTYVEDVKEFERADNLDGAERLLLILVKATEEESKAERCGVAPWYYERLAIIYRKRKTAAKELAILLRFARQRHALGVKPSRLLERLEKVKVVANRLPAK